MQATKQQQTTTITYITIDKMPLHKQFKTTFPSTTTTIPNKLLFAVSKRDKRISKRREKQKQNKKRFAATISRKHNINKNNKTTSLKTRKLFN